MLGTPRWVGGAVGGSGRLGAVVDVVPPSIDVSIVMYGTVDHLGL